MKEDVKIIYDYHYEDERSASDYQLTITRDEAITNQNLFTKLYELFVRIYQTHDANVYGYYLQPAVEHHYQQCKYSKFAFVNGFKENFEFAQKKDLLKPIISDVIKFIEDWIYLTDRNSVVYAGNVRVQKFADAHIARRMEIPIGTPYTQFPEIITPLDAFQQLKFYHAQMMCEYLVSEFKQLHPEPTPEIYFSEIALLNSFIDSVKHDQLDEAFKKEDNNYYHEYLRITNGYYQTHLASTAMGSTASQVYGRYILYKKWLDERLRESFVPKIGIGLPSLDPNPFNDSSLIGRELFEKLFKRTRLSDFFKMPAPRIKGRFWYDINDKQTDKPEKVVRVSEINVFQTRRATKSDFPAIHERINVIEDLKSLAYQYFLNDVIEHVAQMKDYHQSLHKSNERAEDHYELLELADNFVEWIKSDEDKQPKVTPRSDATIKPKLVEQNVIAMVCLYKGIIVTPENKHEIGKQYDHNTGSKIHNKYRHYSTKSNLTRSSGSRRKDSYQFRWFEQTIEILQDSPVALARAQADFEVFKKSAGYN